jgi:hypothetical protein
MYNSTASGTNFFRIPALIESVFCVPPASMTILDCIRSPLSVTMPLVLPFSMISSEATVDVLSSAPEATALSANHEQKGLQYAAYPTVKGLGNRSEWSVL